MESKVSISLPSKTDQEIVEAWDSIFGTEAKITHINAHIPNKTSNYDVFYNFVKQSGSQNSSGHKYWVWFIRENRTGKIVGALTYEQRFFGHDDSIGFFVSKDHILRGYARDAVELLMRQLSLLGMSKICALCYGTNMASRAVLHSLGFVHQNIGVTDWSENQLVFKYVKRLSYSTDGLHAI